MTTDIEWTRNADGTQGRTWNFITGCDQVSAGCDFCYALVMARRLKGMELARIEAGMLDPAKAKYQTDGDPNTSGPGFGVAVHERLIGLPLTVKKPTTWFENSMGDLFHKDVPDRIIAQAFAVKAATPRHTYQIFTKRHARMRALLNSGTFRQMVMGEGQSLGLSHLIPTRLDGGGLAQIVWPLPNVWVGVSVDNQTWAETRVPALLDTPAARRMLSCEPLLGPVDLTLLTAESRASATIPDGIDWVIVGGESGTTARPMHPAWARSLRDQCTASNVPFFFKQWGSWGPAPWSVKVCDPAVGWLGTDEELAAAKAEAERVGATHAYPVWAHNYGHVPHLAGHKPWSAERTTLAGDTHAAIRRWSKPVDGRELDGRLWDEMPALAGEKAV